jgi:hypothetical protein
MRAATEAAVRNIAHHLTHGSLQELDALSRFQPVSVLLQDMDRKFIVCDRSTPYAPVAVFDVAPVPGQPGKGAMWCGLTDKIAHSEWLWSFSGHVRSILNMLQRDYPTISTYVDARNVQHKNWLEAVGFNHVETLPQYGRKEMKFHLLTRIAPSNV